MESNTIYEVEVVYKRPLLIEMTLVSQSLDVYEFLLTYIDLKRIDHKEFFWVILLNRANYILCVSTIGVGGTAGTVVNEIEIYQLAIRLNAHSVILGHCHPSGNLKPSMADLSITKKIKKGCEILNFQLLDHLIVTSEGYYSMTDEGDL